MADSIYTCDEADPITTVADTGTLARNGSATDVSSAAAIAPSGTAAFAFNGASSQIVVTAGFDDLTDVTVEFWIGGCVDDVSYQPLIEAGDINGWAIYLSGGVVRFGKRGVDEVNGSTTVCDGDPHKVLVSCVGGTVTIEVDDVAETLGGSSAGGPWSSSAAYNIGGNGTAFFAGVLDNITISGAGLAPPTVTLSRSSATIAENGGTTSVIATLDHTSSADVTVALSFSGTATNNTDYSRSATSIVVSAGSLTASASVTAINDATFEGSETVVVDVSSVTNGTENGTQQVTITITDDETAPTVTLSRSSATIAENGGTAAVIATLSNLSTQDVTVALSFSGTATNNTDYSRSATSILVPAGSLTASAGVTAINDATFEGSETVVVDVSSVTNGTENGTQQVTITITDDETAPTVTLSLSSATIAENGGSTNVIATLSHPSTQNVTVSLSFSGTATNNIDYIRQADAIVITAGQTTGSISVSGFNDATFEGSETIVVDVSSVTNGTENGTQQVTITITDDETAPTVTLSRSSATIAENGGTAAVIATLSNLSTQDVTVALSFSGTATNNTDYSRSATSILVPAGSLTASASVTAINDATFEGSETVVVDVSSVTNGTENGTQQVTITITDDESEPTVTLSRSSATIAENGGTAAVIATLSNLSTQDVTVALSFSGTATNNMDYSRSATSIVVPAGSLTASASVTAINDATFEGSETVVVDVSSVTNGTENGTQQVTITITDDDPQPLGAEIPVPWVECPREFRLATGCWVRAYLPIELPPGRGLIGDPATVADIDTVTLSVYVAGEVLTEFDELPCVVADVIRDDLQGVSDPRISGANLVLPILGDAFPSANVLTTIEIVVRSSSGDLCWRIRRSGVVMGIGD